MVAVSDAELPRLHALRERGTANGLQGLRLVDRASGARDRAERRRPRGAARPRERDHRLPRGRRARSPRRIADGGGSLLLGHAVLGVHTSGQTVTLETTGGSVTSRGAIACSGASSDRIAQSGRRRHARLPDGAVPRLVLQARLRPPGPDQRPRLSGPGPVAAVPRRALHPPHRRRRPDRPERRPGARATPLRPARLQRARRGRDRLVPRLLAAGAALSALRRDARWPAI